MKILIVEDEAMVAERLFRLVGKVFPEPEISILSTLEEAKKQLKDTPPDLLFLDLNLDSDDGFELLHSALIGPHQTIVASANTERAIEAFEFGVLDFVPKPFTEERLQLAWQRYSGEKEKAKPDLRTLPVKAGSKIKLLKCENIIYFEAQKKFTDIHLTKGASFAMEKSLTSLERLLPASFRRIHRSFIVNLDYAASLTSHRGSQYSLTLKKGTVVPVGRTYIKAFKAFFS